jgi:hypothetical protein
MAKKLRTYRFDEGTKQDIKLLQKVRGIGTETLLLETLVSEAIEKIGEKESNLTHPTVTEVIELFNKNDIYFENREGKLFINSRIFSPQAAFSFMRTRMGELGLHYTMEQIEYDKYSKKTIRDIIEYYVPGHTKNWDSIFK